ncbi:MAG: response regulator [Gemmatimonadales bacterium]
MAEQPLILLANGDRWFTESLESVLGQGGYRVVTAAKRPHVLEQAREHRPDGIILDLGLSGRDSFSLCRALRADPGISRATPIILTTAGPALRTQQLEALRAGAWELRGEPLDTEELLLRLGAYIQGKLEVDRLGAEGLVDQPSGLYNAAGVARRAQELAALIARQGMALACAVFTPSNGATTAASDRLAMTFKSVGRMSDVIGRTGPAEFTVFAPATDATAAERLVNRIAESVARALQVKLRAGVSAATPSAPRQKPVSTNDLMERAREALT